MKETNPGIILQQHGVEVAPDDSRSSEQILRTYVNTGLITLKTEIEVVPQESKI
jgi:hypothetical protein